MMWLDAGTTPASLLFDDPDANLRLHVGVEPHGHPVDAERLDRLVEVDHPALDLDPLRLELVRDVGGRYGPEELALLADTRRERERNLLQARGQLLRRAAPLVLGGLEALPLARNPLEVARRRLEGDAPGKEIVAGVARRDLHDVPGLAEVVDGLAKNDFHG